MSPSSFWVQTIFCHLRAALYHFKSSVDALRISVSSQKQLGSRVRGRCYCTQGAKPVCANYSITASTFSDHLLWTSAQGEVSVGDPLDFNTSALFLNDALLEALKSVRAATDQVWSRQQCDSAWHVFSSLSLLPFFGIVSRVFFFFSSSEVHLELFASFCVCLIFGQQIACFRAMEV